MSGRTKGSVRERQRSDGTILYQARWWDVTPGQEPTQRTKSFLTRAEADDHLAAVHRSKRDQKYRPPSDLTVSQLVREHIDRAAAAERITPRTVHTYRLRAEKMIDPTIGKRRLEMITPLDVQRWIDGLARLGYAATTIHPAIAVLMSALREAAVLGVTDRHLGQGIRRPKLLPTPARTWSAEQARTVLDAVRDDPIYGALYHVAIMAGLRPGELRALCWQDVDLDAGSLTVRRTISKDTEGHEIIVNRTKTGKARVVPIPPAVIEHLVWHRARQRERRVKHADWQDHGVVFDRGDGHWIYAAAWQSFHRRLCDRLGVPAIRAHDLRHSFATLMLETDAHPRVVSEMLGHATVSMTLDRYSHPAHAIQRAAIVDLAEVVFGGAAPGHEPGHEAAKPATKKA